MLLNIEWKLWMTIVHAILQLHVLVGMGTWIVTFFQKYANVTAYYVFWITAGMVGIADLARSIFTMYV